MAENLVELQQQQGQGEKFQGVVKVFKPAGANAPRQPQADVAPVRGDDLIKQTAQSLSVGGLEKKEMQLFQDSQNLLMQVADADPELYDTKIEPELRKRQGWEQAKYVIDTADKFKIDQLKQTHPELFSSPAAALQAFGNSATFQQLTRLQAVGMAANGSPTMTGEAPSYEQHLGELSEWARLLAKAHPTANIVGEIAGFLTPGPQKLFKQWANLGGDGAKMLLEKVSSNPNILKTMAGKMAVGAAENGAGLAAVGAVEGALGTNDDQAFSFDRMASKAAELGAAGTVAGAVLPPLMKYAPFETIGGIIGATAGAPYAAPGTGAAVGAGAGALVRSAVAANKWAPSVLAKLSGGDLRAMRMSNKMGAALNEYAGARGKYEQEFLDFVFSDSVRQLPERQQADKLLPLLPSVDARPLLDFLERKIANPTKEQAAVMGELADRAKWVRGQIKLYKGKPESVSAEGMRSITDGLQEIARGYYQKTTEAIPDWAPMLKDAARIGRLGIVDQAKAFGGQNGANYVALMEKAAEKMQTLKIVTDKFGRDTRYYPEKIKAYVNQMFGKNGEVQRTRMQSLDEAWGTNFTENFEKSVNADKMAAMGPGIINEVPTGAYTKGRNLGAGMGATMSGAAAGLVAKATGLPLAESVAAGSAVGGAIGGAIGSAVSSPKGAAMLIGVSDKVSGVLAGIANNPQILARVQNGRGTPPEIRRMAKSLQTTLEKDGPISMGSVMRVMADTPLFMGLVNYMDLNTTAKEKQALQAGLQQQRQAEQQQQTARAPQGAPQQGQQQRPPVGQGKFY